MLPIYIIIKIAEYLPINMQLQIFKSNKSIYCKSVKICNNYKLIWQQYICRQYDFSDIKFNEYIISKPSEYTFKYNDINLMANMGVKNYINLLPTSIIINIIKYLPIVMQLDLFKLNKSIYCKSESILKRYKQLYDQHINREYNSIDIDFWKYLIYCGFNDWNGVLSEACKNNNNMLMRFAINMGAYECECFAKPIKEHYKY